MLLMEEQRIVPHPRNFTVWYNYFSGAVPELRRTLDALLNSDQRFTEPRNEQVYRKFCVDSQDDRPLHLMAKKMEAELGTLLSVLDRAERGAARYEETLQTASGEIGDSDDAGQLKDIIARLLDETRSMADHSREVESKLNQSANRISQLTDELAIARREAMTDPLTNLANRKVFDTLLAKTTADSAEQGYPLSLLLVDVDHFKRFNDTYGHPVGDQVLKLLAAILRKNIRKRDTAARYGGEEFAIVLPHTTLAAAMELAEGIRRDVASQSLVQRGSRATIARITVSTGVAMLRPGEPVWRFIERADEALYLAKQRGRNQVTSELDLVPGKQRVGT